MAAKKGDSKGKTETGIPFSVNVKEVVSEVSTAKGRKILIAMDGTDFSGNAAEFVSKNLVRKEDHIVLVTIWEQAMLDKLFVELDQELIHPDIDTTHSKHQKLNKTFEKAKCLIASAHLHGLVVEAGARTSPKSVGGELCALAKNMKIDIIVCGTRGLGGIKKALLGSVSSFISNNSPCSCIIVK